MEILKWERYRRETGCCYQVQLWLFEIFDKFKHHYLYHYLISGDFEVKRLSGETFVDIFGFSCHGHPRGPPSWRWYCWVRSIWKKWTQMFADLRLRESQVIRTNLASIILSITSLANSIHYYLPCLFPSQNQHGVKQCVWFKLQGVFFILGLP